MSLILDIRASRPSLPAFAVVGIYWGAFAAQVPDLKAGIGADDGTFGLTLLIGAMGAVTAMWLAPRFDAALGARALQVGGLLTALAFLLPGHAGGVVFFAGALFFCGAATGVLDVVANARVSQLEARHARSLMNLNHAGFSFAYAGSAVMAGLAREAGIPPAVVFTALGGVAVMLSLMMRMAPEVADEAPGGPLRQPIIGRVVIWAGLITFVAFLAENATEAWSALHIERTLGGGAAEGALGPALLGLTMGIGRMTGQMVTRRGHEGATIVGAGLMTAMGAALAAAAQSPAMAYLGFAILGLGVSVVAPLAFALVGQRVAARDRTMAISRTAVIGYMGFFIGPPVMGFVSEAFGLRASFGLVAGLMLLTPLLLLPFRAASRGGPEVPATRPQTPSE